MNDLKQIIEAVLLAADKPMSIDRLLSLFPEDEAPHQDAVRQALADISVNCASHSFELVKVASGYRIQVRKEYAQWVGKLSEERPHRYSRALLETLAIIAYRQPITRGGIEDIRGVAVSTQIVKTLSEREWVRVVGHKDVPGRPSLYATTRQFLDYFNLESLEQLPLLSEVRDLEEIGKELAASMESEEVKNDTVEVNAQEKLNFEDSGNKGTISTDIPTEDPADKTK